MKDVALLAVLVLDQRDARSAVRIVLDLTHRCSHPVLVALEVDDAIHALVTAADATHGDVPVIVASAGLLERLQQRLLAVVARDLREVGNRAKPRALGYRLELTNAHCLRALEDFNRIAFLQRHDCFFPMWTTSDRLTDATILAAMVRGPDAGDRHVEELLDRVSDLSLRRFRMNTERVLAAILVRPRGLLGDDRRDDGFSDSRHQLLPFPFAG